MFTKDMPMEDYYKFVLSTYGSIDALNVGVEITGEGTKVATGDPKEPFITLGADEKWTGYELMSTLKPKMNPVAVVINSEKLPQGFLDLKSAEAKKATAKLHNSYKIASKAGAVGDIGFAKDWANALLSLTSATKAKNMQVDPDVNVSPTTLINLGADLVDHLESTLDVIKAGFTKHAGESPDEIKKGYKKNYQHEAVFTTHDAKVLINSLDVAGTVSKYKEFQQMIENFATMPDTENLFEPPNLAKLEQAKVVYESLQKELNKLKSHVSNPWSDINYALKKMKVANPHYKTLNNFKLTVIALQKTMNSGISNVFNKPFVKTKKPKKPVFDKAGKAYPPNTVIKYINSQVPIDSMAELEYAKKNGETIVSSTSKTYTFNGMDSMIALEDMKDVSQAVLGDFDDKDIDLTKCDQAFHNDAKSLAEVVGEELPKGATIDVKSVKLDIKNKADLDQAKKDYGLWLMYNDQPQTGFLAGNDLFKDLLNYNIFNVLEGHVFPYKEAFEIVDGSSIGHDGKVLKIRHAYVPDQLKDSAFYGVDDKKTFEPCAEKIATMLDEVYGIKVKKMNKDGSPNPTSNIVSIGASGFYIALEKETEDGKDIEHAIKDVDSDKMKSKDKFHREKYEATKLQMKVKTPIITVEQEVMVVNSFGSDKMNVADHKKQMTPLDVLKGDDTKTKGYGMGSNSDMVRDGKIRIFHANTPTNYGSHGSDSSSSYQHSINLSFQPMGELKEAMQAYFKTQGATPTKYKKPVYQKSKQDSFEMTFDLSSGIETGNQANGVHSTSYTGHRIFTSWGYIQVPKSMLGSNAYASGDWDRVICCFKDGSQVAGSLTAEDMIAHISSELPISTSKGDLAEVLMADRTDEDNENLKIMKMGKFIMGGTLWQSADPDDKKYMSSDNNMYTFGVDQPLESQLGTKVTNYEEFEQAMMTMVGKETISRKTGNSSASNETIAIEHILNTTPSPELLYLRAEDTTEDVFQEEIKSALKGIECRITEDLVGGEAVLPDAHIQFALGRTGTYSSMGLCGTNPEIMAKMFGSYGADAKAVNMGFAPSCYRQDCGVYMGGMSEDDDHNNYASSTRIYQRVAKNNPKYNEASVINCDLSYMERADGFYNWDYFGDQKNVPSGSHGRYDTDGITNTDRNEILSNAHMSKSISVVVSASQSYMNKTVEILEKGHGKGNKTHAWEIAGNHTEVFDKYANELKELGYIETTDYPEDGFKWAGFVDYSDISRRDVIQRKKVIMSQMIAECRLIESKARQGA